MYFSDEEIDKNDAVHTIWINSALSGLFTSKVKAFKARGYMQDRVPSSESSLYLLC